MGNPLQQTIEALAKEKGIEPEVIVTAIEDAVLTASRRYYSREFKSTEHLRTKFNYETGQVELFVVRQIVEDVTDPETEISLAEARGLYGDEAEVDMEIEFPKPTDVLGRIAAQTAKQVIFQKVREAERENVYEEYSDRLGEVVVGAVKRFENGDIIVESGRIEALLPRREQSRAENYTTGDRIRAVIREVNKNTKGPQIILSRTDPVLLIKLFEQEVPENLRPHGDDSRCRARGGRPGQGGRLFAGARRRPGGCVRRHEGHAGPDHHPRAARGEKIDIVDWSEDPALFVTNAISPARVQRVTIVDDVEKVVEVVVEDRQLSLAIGKKGQNVRLAAKLTGWKIDIKSEEEKRREVEAQFEGLEAEETATLTLPGLDEEQLLKLSAAGLDTADSLIAASPADLATVAGVDEATAEELQAAVREQVAAVERAAMAAAGQAEGTGSAEAEADPLGDDPEPVAEAVTTGAGGSTEPAPAGETDRGD